MTGVWLLTDEFAFLAFLLMAMFSWKILFKADELHIDVLKMNIEYKVMKYPEIMYADTAMFKTFSLDSFSCFAMIHEA